MIALLIPAFCYSGSSFDQLILDRLSADKKTLNLSGTNIGPREARILAEMELLDSVEILLLQGNKIKYKGLKALARSPHARNLKQLDLWGIW